MNNYSSSYRFLIVSGDVFPKKFSSHLVIFFFILGVRFILVMKNVSKIILSLFLYH